jgi:hypothetical protein
MTQLHKWREEGDRLVVCLDANEDIYKKSLGKSLTKRNDLNMLEVVGEFTGKKKVPTFFRGSKPIDGIWATPDLVVTHACIMPAGYGVGDHRLFVVDFQTRSLIGEAPFRVKRFTTRHLNTKVSSGAMKKHISRLEDSLDCHQLIECLGQLHTTSNSKEAFHKGLNKLDKQSKDIMLNAEKKCCCIKSGRIPFSPEAALWICRTQVYRSLLRYHGGLIQNRGNLKQTSRCCGILNCLALLVEEVLLRLKICLKQCYHFRKHGKQYRRKHLHDCLRNAQESMDEQWEKKILAIINREKDRSFWRRINYVMGKARGGAVHWVLVGNGDQEGTLTKNITQELVQEVIFANIHRKQFFLVEAAPICMGNLRGKFGYNAVTRTAKAILNGTYEYPNNFYQVTREICEECACIWEMIPINSLDTFITKEQWRHQWKGR